MAELTNLGTIRIRALRGVPTSLADSLHLVTFTATEGQTTFATGLTSGSFETKDCTMTARGVQIPYSNLSVSGASLVYDDGFAAIGALQASDVVEVRVWT